MRGTLRETASVARNEISEVAKLLDPDPAVLGESAFEAVDLDVMAARFGAMAGATNRYASWAQQVRLQKTLISAGLSELEARMRFGNLDGSAAAVELRCARAESLWKRALAENPDLRGIGSKQRHELVSAFTALERQHLKNHCALRPRRFPPNARTRSNSINFAGMA